MLRHEIINYIGGTFWNTSEVEKTRKITNGTHGKAKMEHMSNPCVAVHCVVHRDRDDSILQQPTSIVDARWMQQVRIRL